MAWDAEHGVPLRAAVYASGAADPVLELKATDISFGKVAASDLAIPEPAGAHVVDLNPSAAAGAAGPAGRRRDRAAGRPGQGRLHASSRPTRSSACPARTSGSSTSTARPARS